MNTRLWIISLIILAVLSSACGSVRPKTSTPTALPVGQAKVQLTTTSAESHATIDLPTSSFIELTATDVPEVEPTNASQQTMDPITLPFSRQTLQTIRDNLRRLLGAPDLTLAYQSITQSPNASNHPAALLVDTLGNSYYVSLDTFQPIEFTLGQPVHLSQGGSMTVEELRATAEQLASRQSTRFDRVKEWLIYSEGDKSGENFFFRWVMPDTDVGGMPATLQFGLRQDGSLFSYLNSLDFLP